MRKLLLSFFTFKNKVEIYYITSFLYVFGPALGAQNLYEEQVGLPLHTFLLTEAV